MKALYELLAKVGTNPKLRAWAMEQLIKLKKLNPSYKEGFTHKMDLNKVKDIKNPNWLMEEVTKAKGYNLKNKVVDIAKAKDKVRWDKVDKQRDKDKFYGVTGQVNTWLKKIKDEHLAWEAKIAKDEAWFTKLMKAKAKGDPRAIKILDDHFKKMDKDFADKIIPFKPKKAEGGIITVSDPGMGDGPFMMEEFLEAVKQGFKGTYDDYIDQIDRSPRDYLAEGGVIEEVWDKKGIEDAKESLEGMKPHLMEESYIQLLDFLDSKQKELDMDIMESAGGLGEMLGEGGRVGMQGGGWPGMLAWLAQQGPKVWKWMNKPGNNPYDLYKKYLKSVKERSIKGDMKSLAPELGAITAGGIIANRWASKKLKESINLDRLNFAEEQIEDLKKDQFYSEHPDLLEERINEIRKDATRERKWWDKGAFNDGGRVGMMYGGDPGFAFSYGGSWADWKDNHASEMPLMDYINQKLPKARHPFSDSKYNSGGPVHHLDGLAIQDLFGRPYSQLTSSQQSELDNFKPEAYEPIPKAEGGRIGMAEGDTPSESWMRDYYFDGKGNYDTWMTFDQFKLGPGKDLWLNRKAKGGRVGFKKGGKGGIGDLMGELYRLFEISPLLASPELIDVIQKIPFDKGGKVKKGGGPKMSRRSFLQLMGGLASLPIVGKYFKLAKPLKDITVKIRKGSWNEDVDYGTSGNVLFDFVGKSKVGRELIKKYLPKNYKKEWGMDPKDAYKIVKKAKDKGLNIKVTELADETTTVVKDGVINPKWYLGGRTLDRQSQQRLYNEAQKRFKKQTSRENIKEHLDDTSFFENDMYRWPKPNYGGTPTRYTDEIIDLIEPVVKKAEGGSVGQPPIQLGPLDLTPRASGGFTQGQPYGANTREKTWSDNIGISGMLDLPGGFSLTGEYDKYRTKDRLYTVDDVYLDERVKDDHDRWRLGLQWKKKFAKGGKAWRPKSAPKLTTTIPPERGPTPQGLTYLTGDDIVQNIG